jgi:cytochrome oxidase Cu insertion factor (SCO1/SenC/PrrC family)
MKHSDHILTHFYDFGFSTDFHPRLVGLTGTPEQVDKITRDYRVFFSKTADPEQDADYLVDHSIFMYLMDPEGKFVDYFGVNLDEKQIVEQIKGHLIAQNKLPPDTMFNRLKEWFSR